MIRQFAINLEYEIKDLLFVREKKVHTDELEISRKPLYELEREIGHNRVIEIMKEWFDSDDTAHVTARYANLKEVLRYCKELYNGKGHPTTIGMSCCMPN